MHRGRAKYATSEHGKAKIEAYRKSELYKRTVVTYNRSPQGKAAQKAYSKSEKSKARYKKYSKSEKGKRAAAERRIKGIASAYSRKYRQTEKGKMANRLHARRYGQSELGKAALERRKASGKVVEYRKRYNRTEKGRAANIRGKAKRRDAERQKMHTLSWKDWRDILKAYNNACFYCGATNVRLERDHLIPISVDGGHTVRDNIVPACRSCNARKGNKLPSQFKLRMEKRAR
jgi:5-methylcytosine-specific restriction endonuclease McrA